MAVCSGADQPFQRSFVANQECGTTKLSQFLVAKFAQDARHGFPRSADQLRNLFVRQRDLDPNAFFGLFAVARPLQKQARQLLRYGVRETERADHFVCGLAILAQVVRGVQAGIGVILQELQEIVALDEIELAWLERFGREFVGLAGNRAMQTENLTGLGNAQDQRLAIARSRGQLYAAGADDINAARRLALHEQYRPLGIRAGVLDLLQVFKGGLGKIAEEAGLTQLADQTIFCDLKPVGRTHADPFASSAY